MKGDRVKELFLAILSLLGIMFSVNATFKAIHGIVINNKIYLTASLPEILFITSTIITLALFFLARKKLTVGKLYDKTMLYGSIIFLLSEIITFIRVFF